jgi:ATP-dependent RNA helicase DDX18/HAS1
LLTESIIPVAVVKITKMGKDMMNQKAKMKKNKDIAVSSGPKDAETAHPDAKQVLKSDKKGLHIQKDAKQAKLEKKLKKLEQKQAEVHEEEEVDMEDAEDDTPRNDVEDEACAEDDKDAVSTKDIEQNGTTSESSAAAEPSTDHRVSGFFSDITFESLQICDPLKRALKDMEFSKLTEIQVRMLHVCME